MSIPREAREVVVVGGGPAGSATAAWLASAGHDVLVLDRARFPRRKPCAECVNPAGVAALRRLGAWDAVRAAGPARLDGWRIGALGGRSFDGCFPGAVHGVGIPREVLDDILLRHAESRGAEARTGLRVTGLLRDAHGRVTGVRAHGDGGEWEIAARLVVGADGLRSVVLRRLGLLARRPKLRKLALTAHVAGFDGAPARGEVHVSGRGACLGIAPVGGGLANVTVVVPEERSKEVAGDPGGYFDAALVRYGFPQLRRVDEVIATGPFDCPIRSAVADGALLVGDAAGYYDPFTGQGIYRALRGGELAADAAHAALRAGDTSASALAPYERARRAAFGPGERMQRIVEAFVSRPRLLGAVARRFTARPALADAVIRVTGDVSPVGSLFTPRVLAGLVW
ncbi:NAD(P)/FAD-dependent oxidoreductase [Longimicrobium sp.]|uniref:NAD(P)/FAD-dependent oxidoreductase n=1 Tax=Longimicrobium sp. TaxID=2029185 RepID=UPI002CEB1A19|nr:NAD(P)/FAD-dependent oxidoreductase [Longimicrobium sp.]HSU17804.1 NAD(P)/FAD-dependent oxidoreductase [Longimicrobium sp.]